MRSPESLCVGDSGPSNIAQGDLLQSGGLSRVLIVGRIKERQRRGSGNRSDNDSRCHSGDAIGEAFAARLTMEKRFKIRHRATVVITERDADQFIANFWWAIPFYSPLASAFWALKKAPVAPRERDKKRSACSRLPSERFI